ncbi:acetyl-CoA C-acetyltransferase [Rhodobacteraceae bacterium RKSG542]|uniref:acetyl-CoA C-acetyltransferase n=1 Tax=Pseudovibrio flavus TaxID=2529854 RepID=UPI0012BD58EE|nr:acetyl-CoA C-acetyltransferase [Pseudovibrio flavus]MTI18802.1 acetyl-CoA C-acetyltransferase [Pseudovibrio flavus]
MAHAYIFDHVRTPRGRGKPDGSLHSVPSVELAAQVLRQLRQRNSLDTALVDDVILGCVDPIGEAGGDVARAATFSAGYARSVAGVQVNRFCASGLEAVNLASAQVMAGQQQMIIAGGVESMSRVGLLSSGGAWSIDPRVAIPSFFMPQGVSADLIATKYGFSREDVDAYAVSSQKRAAKAWENGYFKNSVFPVVDVTGQTLLDQDEHMRPQTTMDTLSGLRPAFERMGVEGGFDAVAIQAHPELEMISHVHHAGNASGIVDGAAGVLIGSRIAGRKAGLTPRARIRSFSSIGSDPSLMLTGPVDVTQKLFEHAGLTWSDIDLIEINEAFSSVVLRYMQAFDLDPETVNVNGGAIAMGHPVGATGAMLVGTVLDELERRDLSTALVTLCVGAGMGTATFIERV